MTDYPHYYAWKNNEKRVTLYKRHMRVIARGKMNSALVEFENGQREIISRNAIRKIKAGRIKGAITQLGLQLH